MEKLTSTIHHTIPISQFYKGKAAQVFAGVRESGVKLVVKDDEPECVLMSPTMYMRLMDELADARLQSLALQRLLGGGLEHLSSQQDVMDSFGITAEELDTMEEVEIE